MTQEEYMKAWVELSFAAAYDHARRTRGLLLSYLDTPDWRWSPSWVEKMSRPLL